MNKLSLLILTIVLFSMVTVVEARRGGGNARGHSVSHVNKGGGSYNKNVNRGGNTVNNRGGNNINISGNDVNINVNKNYHNNNGYHHGGCCYYNRYHPVATAAAVTATAMVVGSIISTLPVGCQTVIVNGFAYQQCGSTWYQPQISGSTTNYVVINDPH